MLVLLLVVAPVVVWRYAVGGTVERWRGTVKARRQIELLSASQPHVPTTPGSQGGQGGQRSPEGLGVAEELILSGRLVTGLLPLIEAEGVSIESFTPCVTSEADGVRLATGQLVVRGDFIGIVKLIDELERTRPDCKIVSTHFRSSRPRGRQSAKTLSCTICVQQITVEP